MVRKARKAGGGRMYGQLLSREGDKEIRICKSHGTEVSWQVEGPDENFQRKESDTYGLHQ